MEGSEFESKIGISMLLGKIREGRWVGKVDDFMICVEQDVIGQTRQVLAVREQSWVIVIKTVRFQYLLDEALL
jgi:hypothetical protein